MQFMRETNRLLAGVLVAFGLVALAAIYWAVAGSDTILQMKENPRLVEAGFVPIGEVAAGPASVQLG